MKTVEIHCRKFDEWDEPTQKKILNKHRDINIEGSFWYEGELEYWCDKLEEFGFIAYEWKTKKNHKNEDVRYKDILIAFSGFCSQGDGASFTGKIDIKKWIAVNNPTKYQRILKLLETGSLYVYDNVIQRNRWHNYVHWNTTTSYLVINQYDDGHRPNIEGLIDELCEEVFKHHQDLNKEIYQDLENLYEGEMSDDCVKDTLIVNEYEFDENGDIW